MSLTDEQRAIVTLGYQHCVINAVAGSGKTTTLAWRIRHLLEQGHDPERMLILMFNRSARADFQRKLCEISRDTGLNLPEIRTYHAMGLRLYRRFVRDGYLPPWQGDVLSEQEVNYQLWQLTLQLAPEDLRDEIRRNKKESVETAANFIDITKTTLDRPELVFEQMGFDNRYRYLLEVYYGFERWRRDHKRITFADMLHEPVQAIHDHPQLRRLVENKMDLILVDEYQDTNEIQHLLLKYIAGDRARVTVVGDPDQTIYEFRGARPDFILKRFAREFPDAVTLNLSYTFRYGHRVSLLANHLISHNQDRKEVLCHSHPGTPETRIHLARPREDADYIAQLAEKHRKEGGHLNDIAILVRIWSQSVPIELRLLARQIPYRIEAHKGALFTREVESLMQLLALAAGEHRDPGTPEARRSRGHAFRQLLRFPHVGLKEPELNNLADYLAGFSCDWGQVLMNMDTGQWKPLPGRKVRLLGEALAALEGNSSPAHRLLADYVEKTELFEGIRSLALTHETADERIGTVQGFQHYLATLNLDATMALSHLRDLKSRASNPGEEGLHLSTIHRTKGLEWPTVVIPGLREKILPYTARGDDNLPALMESERRLLYVGITRARENLHLLSCDTEAGNNDDSLPSRFVAEMHFPLSEALGNRLHDNPEGPTLKLDGPATPVAHRYAKLHDLSLQAPQPDSAVTENSGPVWHAETVVHVLFGKGQVIREEERSFEVRFDNGRTLNFSKKSAHLYFQAAV